MYTFEMTITITMKTLMNKIAFVKNIEFCNLTEYSLIGLPVIINY